MFKITDETIHKIMVLAIHEIVENPIRFKWLREYNLELAFSADVSMIVAKYYDTVLNDKELECLLKLVCEYYIKSLVFGYETRQ